MENEVLQMRTFGIICAVFAALILLIVLPFGLHMCSAVTQNAHSVIDVVQEQTEAHELLRKYAWFKDASAQLDKKRADIQVYDSRFKALKNSYSNAPRKEWSREDREQSNIWEGEVVGVKASYNALAADYNAAMAKINYRFTNVGMLPQGAEQPLPREYKPYDYGTP